ncbi:MAG: helix-turn-helix domain-containing protein [Chitinispirillia bacterium]|nr:helix-turn-helix domain-containing protein [Chitinispirillia bacterium]
MAKKETFLKRFLYALEMRDISQTELAQKTGIGKSAINHYKTGRYEPKQDGVYLIALALDVSEAWLMGYDVPMARINYNEAEKTYNCQLTQSDLNDQIKREYGKKAIPLLKCFDRLNDAGRDQALVQISNLGEISKYIE